MSSSRTRRSTSRLLTLRLPLAASVAAALVVGPTAVLDASGDDVEPVATAMEKVSVAGVSDTALENTAGVGYNAPVEEPQHHDRTRGAEPEHAPVGPDDSALVALTTKRETGNFSALGLTWEGEQEPVTVWVRTKTTGTGWSDWEYLPSADDHAPDPGTGEGDGTRAGTDALMVPESDGVQVRVEAEDGTAPRGMKINLIDPKAADQDARVGQSSAPAGSAAAAATKPEILSRAQWGADESLRREDPVYATIEGGFIHHTATTNDYTRSDVAADIRAIYTFHVNGRGWNDIGYNFLVDKFGRTWEGRYGGTGEPVVGAHTLGYNTGSFGVSVLGNHENLKANWAVRNALAKLSAWKLTLHGVDATSRVTINDKRFEAISGHRDGYPTVCPGDALYAQLPAIRQATADLQPTIDPPFDDVVPYTTDFVPEIRWLKDEGITNGYPDGNFGPKDRISREAVAAFFYRAAGEPPVTSDPDFTDVDASSKFAKEIAWLQDEGITTGHPDGSFGPKERISREALAAFMTRFVLDGPPPESSAPYQFSDVEGTQFADHIAWIADQGITNGYPDGRFGPRDRISREAVAAFLYRSQDLLDG